MNNQTMKLVVSPDDNDVAYLVLPGHPGIGTPDAVKKTIPLSSLLELNEGTELHIDLDADNKIIGVEILV